MSERNVDPRGPSQNYPDSATTITNDPKNVDKLHQNSDLNSSIFAQHHSLGSNPNQASPGNHIHNGATSKQLQDVNFTGVLVGPNTAGIIFISFTALTTFTQTITFNQPFNSPPAVTVNIASGAAVASHWYSKPINVSAIGFDFNVFAETGIAAQTWASIPCTWIAVGLS